MKYLKISLAFILLFTSHILFSQTAKQAKTPDYSRPPRQKLYISGELIDGKKEISYSMTELETLLPLKTLQIKDPFLFNKTTTFYGHYLSDLINHLSKVKYKKLKMNSYDGYEVEITEKTIKENNFFVAFKDQLGYLDIKRMGPTRIISPNDSSVTDDKQIVDGIYWVWLLKSIKIE